MCGACAVLGNAPDWVDRVGNPEGVGHSENLTRIAERQRRVDLVNLLLEPTRMKLLDLGNNLSLRGPTGRVEIVDGLACGPRRIAFPTSSSTLWILNNSK